ncbi:four helix bundle protein [Echinicola marina]|uniref:four helix bundle protein n=1 Tax=Echinicola marina TaxID=2859768 RepID=UPI001CF6F27A|nr:four helix bundle protein [Echinicola marina]UCS93255.1 four helix bundle protein [Echinicola marina]
MSERHFNFKELRVWQKSMDLAEYCIELVEELNTPGKHFRLIEQFESCSASVPQNIAEGKGRNTDKEFKQFLYYSRGSLYEMVTLANLFHRRNWITTAQLNRIESEGLEIASMLKALINAI